jgi:drug/metabolite transporter (DMT)-like permease
MFQVFLMYALFASIFSVGKIAVYASQPYFLTAVRMLLAGGCLTAYLFIKNKNQMTVPKSLWKLVFLVAFFNVFITNAFEFWGLQYMNAGKTCLIYSLAPFVAALIAYVFGTEKMTSRKWLGLAVGFISLSPMMIEPWLEDVNRGVEVLELWAEGALLISAITSVIGWNFVKKLTVDHHVSGGVVNAYSFLLAGVMSLVSSAFLEEWNPIPVMVWGDFIWTLLYIVVIHNLICYSIYAASLQKFSVTFMTFAGLSGPLFAGFFGWIFLGEEITLTFAIALIGITAGLVIFSQESRTVLQSKN